jgi:hypothetical protein
MDMWTRLICLTNNGIINALFGSIKSCGISGLGKRKSRQERPDSNPWCLFDELLVRL